LRYHRIKNPSDEADKQEAFQQIISSGKISDTANFTAGEDRLLDLANEAPFFTACFYWCDLTAKTT
jgi:hypothetical protein